MKMMNIIPKANQIIFFVISLSFILFLAILLTIEMMHTGYSSSGVEIIKKNNNEETLINIEYEKNYFQSMQDIHVIEIISEKIILNENASEGNLYSSYSERNNSYNSRDVVNLIFVSEDGYKMKLFESNTLIIDMYLANLKKENDQFLLDKNVYSVAMTDSNQDGYLKYDDKKDLYLSDYNGKNLTLIMEKRVM